MGYQLWCFHLGLQGDLLQHQEDPLAVDIQRLPSGPEAFAHSKRHIANEHSKKGIA